MEIIDITSIIVLFIQIITLFTLVITTKNTIKSEVDKKEITKNAPFIEMRESISEIKSELKDIKSEVRDLQSSQRVNEKDRLRECILNFGDKLRVNLKEEVYDINLHSFDNIFSDYEKYKKLNGNGYVDEEMNFIKKEFQKLH